MDSNTLQLADIFTDDMILQRDSEIRIWGTASPTSQVEVQLSNHSQSTQSNEDGRWEISIPSMPTSFESYELSVSCGKETIVIQNILIGDVWIAGGQSNMEWPMENTLDGQIALPTINNPHIRNYTVPRLEGFEKESPKNRWQLSNAESAKQFSAVAYFFAENIYKHHKIPIGIVNCNVGASSCEAWMSEECLNQFPEFQYLVEKRNTLLNQYDAKGFDEYLADLEKWSESDLSTEQPTEPPSPYHRQVATALYRTMLSRIIPLSVKGTIWYQGESNANQKRGFEYRSLFPAMIQHWRDEFQNPSMPFYFVQLSAFSVPGDQEHKNLWAELREAQLFTAQQLPHTSMAVSADWGEENDIHPRNKGPIGKRLALLARSHCYNENVVTSGPSFASLELEEDRAILHFKDIGTGLIEKENHFDNFLICGTDKVFHPRNASISNDSVIVTSPSVKKPLAVRYGWHNYFVPSLFNKEGLPASPFRTDRFPLITEPS